MKFTTVSKCDFLKWTEDKKTLIMTYNYQADLINDLNKKVIGSLLITVIVDKGRVVTQTQIQPTPGLAEKGGVKKVFLTKDIIGFDFEKLNNSDESDKYVAETFIEPFLEELFNSPVA